MASSHLWGFLSDTQGRRIVMLYTLTASTFFSVSSAFVQNFTLFLVCRFLVGFLWVKLKCNKVLWIYCEILTLFLSPLSVFLPSHRPFILILENSTPLKIDQPACHGRPSLWGLRRPSCHVNIFMSIKSSLIYLAHLLKWALGECSLLTGP